MTRRATEPTTLGGYRIPVGAEVGFSLTALHRDPRAFDPDRWLDRHDPAEVAPRPPAGNQGPGAADGHRAAVRPARGRGTATQCGVVSADRMVRSTMSSRVAGISRSAPR
ncbi:cytochrome P450 [Amycolatopsis sp. NPDC051371]|uniref:cytochrome P450 n=1 Tax=Amycolatopsis sp. NPDC051371 TaxID=3155800 RepID=UPI00343934AE